MCKQVGQQEAIWFHSAMLLAQAVQGQFEEVKLGTTGFTPQGFYYDFDLPNPLTEQDLAVIEQEMRRLAAEREPHSCRRVSKEEALRLFEFKGERWKTEFLNAVQADEWLWLYEQGEFVDLCPEGHIFVEAGSPSAFKLLSVAGAYWRGDSKNPVLQRVYGVAHASKQELNRYLAQLEEAQKRDHRKLGKQLELFLFTDEAPGMPFYLPKGTVIRGELEALAREFLRKFEYEEVRTPFIMNRQMWEQSGHWEHYRDNMYFSEIDHHHYAVKPMNCPGHMLLYKNKVHSYRELPIRFAEFGQVHRYEYSGALNGLFRVRTFCQDDAHIFVTTEQIESEILRTIQLVQAIYTIFGFDYSLELSTRPVDSMGSDEQWQLAEAALAKALEKAGLPYSLNPGDGAFYGPKIDFHIKDALNRSHQCGTIQLDFQMPEKFGLSYVDAKNEKQIPIVIHRAVYGSIDRFLGILIEHYAGAFPTWLAPVQVIVLPVSDVHSVYADKVARTLRESGVRVQLDDRKEKLGYRVREAQLQKIPYIAVVGDAEQSSGSMQIRTYGKKEQQQFRVEDFKNLIRAEGIDASSFIGRMPGADV